MRPLELHRQIELEELLNEIAKYQQGGGLSVFGQNQVNLPSQQAGIQSGVIGLNPLSTQQLTGIQENNLSRDFRERQFDFQQREADQRNNRELLKGLYGNAVSNTSNGTGLDLTQKWQSDLHDQISTEQIKLRESMAAMSANGQRIDPSQLVQARSGLDQLLQSKEYQRAIQINDYKKNLLAAAAAQADNNNVVVNGNLLADKLEKIAKYGENPFADDVDLASIMDTKGLFYNKKDVNTKISEQVDLFEKANSSQILEYSKDKPGLIEKWNQRNKLDINSWGTALGDILWEDPEVQALVGNGDIKDKASFVKDYVLPRLNTIRNSQPNEKELQGVSLDPRLGKDDFRVGVDEDGQPDVQVATEQQRVADIQAEAEAKELAKRETTRLAEIERRKTKGTTSKVEKTTNATVNYNSKGERVDSQGNPVSQGWSDKFTMDETTLEGFSKGKMKIGDEEYTLPQVESIIEAGTKKDATQEEKDEALRIKNLFGIESIAAGKKAAQAKPIKTDEYSFTPNDNITTPSSFVEMVSRTESNNQSDIIHGESAPGVGTGKGQSSAVGEFQTIWSLHGSKIKNITGLQPVDKLTPQQKQRLLDNPVIARKYGDNDEELRYIQAYLENPEAQGQYFDYLDQRVYDPVVSDIIASGTDKGFSDEELKYMTHFMGSGVKTKQFLETGKYFLDGKDMTSHVYEALEVFGNKNNIDTIDRLKSLDFGGEKGEDKLTPRTSYFNPTTTGEEEVLNDPTQVTPQAEDVSTTLQNKEVEILNSLSSIPDEDEFGRSNKAQKEELKEQLEIISNQKESIKNREQEQVEVFKTIDRFISNLKGEVRIPNTNIDIIKSKERDIWLVTDKGGSVLRTPEEMTKEQLSQFLIEFVPNLELI